MPDAELGPASLGLEAARRLSDCALREFAGAIERVGLAHRLSEGRARPGHLVLEMDAYTVHPYKLVRGLAEHAARAEVQIHERARVRAVEAAPYGARVRLDGGGELLARKVIVCTNAYTSTLEVGERVRALAVHSFMTATAPLDRSAVHAIARDGDFTVELSTQAYYRMHRDRIIYGGVDRVFAPAGGDFSVPTGVQSRLARHMKASFPGVADLAIAEAWSGKFHATATGLPIIRPSTTNPAVVLNVGYGGNGVALTLACARLAAAVARDGRFACTDDARLLSVIRGTRISVRDAVRTVGRLARRLAHPWLAS
jgi:glycine/D-amino acid oxidase-like deaminating enzyme